MKVKVRKTCTRVYEAELEVALPKQLLAHADKLTIKNFIAATVKSDDLDGMIDQSAWVQQEGTDEYDPYFASSFQLELNENVFLAGPGGYGETAGFKITPVSQKTEIRTEGFKPEPAPPVRGCEHYDYEETDSPFDYPTYKCNSCGHTW